MRLFHYLSAPRKAPSVSRMPAINRVLDAKPIRSLSGSSGAGGGQGLEAARKFGASGVFE